MTQDEIFKVHRQFFSQGCKNLNFNECEKLWSDFNNSIQGPGCTSCKRRRMKNKYGRMLEEILRPLNFEEVRKLP